MPIIRLQVAFHKEKAALNSFRFKPYPLIIFLSIQMNLLQKINLVNFTL